jgi:hypothetical protein
MSRETERLRDIVDALDSTPYGDVLRDDHRRHQIVFEAMAGSSDPMTREVGEQLLSGAAAPRQLLQHADYRQFLADSLATARNLDFDLERLQSDIAATRAEDQLTGDPGQDLHADHPPARREDESSTDERR